MKHNMLPSAELVAQLYRHFPYEAYEHIHSLTAPPEQAPLSGDSKEFVPYVRANKGASRAVIYVPGFGEGITNKLPFATELAAQGCDVILPGQNRSGLVQPSKDKNAAVETQARNIIAVATHAGVLKSFDMVAHSFGGLVAEEVVRQLQEIDIDTSEMNVVLLASAGVAKEKSYRNLLGRWFRFIGSEWGPDNKEVPDRTGEMGKASLRNLAANPPQTAAEARALRHERIHIRRLCSKVGQVVLACYKDDKMFPPEQTYSAIEEVSGDAALEVPENEENYINNLYVITPVAFGNPNLGEKVGRKPGAVHDDEQFNSRRVVNAIVSFLRPNPKLKPTTHYEDPKTWLKFLR